MELFDVSKLKTLPLSDRKSKSNILDIAVNPDSPPPQFKGDLKILKDIAGSIKLAREKNSPVILAYGAHLIKNGLGPLLIRMIEENYLSHLATNGASSIHDWELSFIGKTEEDVRANVAIGQFGLWEETGRYINSAIIEGASEGRGYGESIGKMICTEMLNNKKIEHKFKGHSIQGRSYELKIPLTVHPALGQDIIHTHPIADFAAIGKTAQVDFLRFTDSVSKLEGGVYISVGSAIMSPMIFEKSLSMARNVNKDINNFLIVVNDIQESGNWQWDSPSEPKKENPAYYLRFCKTFSRMGAKKMYYIQEDNRAFLQNLYHLLKQ